MIEKLQYITHDIPGTSHARLAQEACAAGARWIQLRVKNRNYEEWKSIAQEVQAICRAHNAKLIVNDNVNLAAEIGADGVHVGKEDMSVSQARMILERNVIIGGTANTFEDIKKHFYEGADYVGLGPFRFTKTKEKLSPVLGAEGYRGIMQKCAAEKINIPVIAIGGITVNDVSEILETGIYGVAVSSAISLAKEKSETIKMFNELMKREHETT